MPIPTEPAEQMNGWTYRLRPASSHPARLMLMLHGWTGTENSMWFFARNMQERYAVLLPRAPHPDPEGGYTWRLVSPGSRSLPGLEELRPAAEALLRFLDDWSPLSGVNVDLFDVTGFSQGAALAYTLAVLFPRRVERLAALSGFLPAGWEAHVEGMKGKRIFISHGRADEIVPVDLARRDRVRLEQAGASVVYCESEAGHKVGKECIKGMDSFFNIG